MKKAIACTLVLLLAAALLSACGSAVKNARQIVSLASELADADSSGGSRSGRSIATGSGSDGSGSNDADDDFVYGNGTDYIASHLTGDFSITYRLTTSADDSGSADLTMMRSSEGYLIRSGITDILYVKNGDVYDIYFPTDDGYQLLDFLDPASEEQIQSNLVTMYSLMAHYSDVSGLKKDGDEVIAGRNCDIYKESAAGMGMAVGMSYSIDKETGVCLKTTFDAAMAGNIMNMTFECTEFLTSGVTLPAH